MTWKSLQNVQQQTYKLGDNYYRQLIKLKIIKKFNFLNYECHIKLNKEDSMLKNKAIVKEACTNCGSLSNHACLALSHSFACLAFISNIF